MVPSLPRRIRIGAIGGVRPKGRTDLVFTEKSAPGATSVKLMQFSPIPASGTFNCREYRTAMGTEIVTFLDFVATIFTKKNVAFGLIRVGWAAKPLNERLRNVLLLDPRRHHMARFFQNDHSIVFSRGARP